MNTLLAGKRGAFQYCSSACCR